VEPSAAWAGDPLARFPSRVAGYMPYGRQSIEDAGDLRLFAGLVPVVAQSSGFLLEDGDPREAGQPCVKLRLELISGRHGWIPFLISAAIEYLEEVHALPEKIIDDLSPQVGLGLPSQ